MEIGHTSRGNAHEPVWIACGRAFAVAACPNPNATFSRGLDLKSLALVVDDPNVLAPRSRVFSSYRPIKSSISSFTPATLYRALAAVCTAMFPISALEAYFAPVRDRVAMPIWNPSSQPSISKRNPSPPVYW